MKKSRYDRNITLAICDLELWFSSGFLSANWGYAYKFYFSAYDGLLPKALLIVSSSGFDELFGVVSLIKYVSATEFAAGKTWTTYAGNQIKLILSRKLHNLAKL